MTSTGSAQLRPPRHGQDEESACRGWLREHATANKRLAVRCSFVPRPKRRLPADPRFPHRWAFWASLRHPHTRTRAMHATASTTVGVQLRGRAGALRAAAPRAVIGRRTVRVVAKDFPKPDLETENYRRARRPPEPAASPFAGRILLQKTHDERAAAARRPTRPVLCVAERALIAPAWFQCEFRSRSPEASLARCMSWP